MHYHSTIKDFSALFNTMQDTTHSMAIYGGMQECIKRKSRNKRNILDEELHTMELYIHHHIQVQVQGSDGDRISQMCQCTASQRWRSGDGRND
jgi:hypothetical protein